MRVSHQRGQQMQQNMDDRWKQTIILFNLPNSSHTGQIMEYFALFWRIIGSNRLTVIIFSCMPWMGRSGGRARQSSMLAGRLRTSDQKKGFRLEFKYHRENESVGFYQFERIGRMCSEHRFNPHVRPPLKTPGYTRHPALTAISAVPPLVHLLLPKQRDYSCPLALSS